MTNREIVKPFSWGFITGGIAFTAVAFSLGWVVTSGVNYNQVQTAWIDGQAAICTSLVQAHRESTGDATELYGNLTQTREAREKLANDFAVALPGEESADSRVVRACAHMLNKPTA